MSRNVHPFSLKTISFYRDVAQRVQKQSYCERRKVGAVLFDERRMPQYGYNGTAPGEENVCEIGNVTGPNTIHAEKNCLYNIANSKDIASEFAMFVTTAPCYECAGQILSAKIPIVFFEDLYRTTSGIERLLRSENVEVYRYLSDGTVMRIDESCIESLNVELEYEHTQPQKKTLERCMGEFALSQDYIRSASEYQSIFDGFVPTRVYSDVITNQLIYRGYHIDFDEVDVGQIVPLYRVVVTKSPPNKLTRTFEKMEK